MNDFYAALLQLAANTPPAVPGPTPPPPPPPQGGGVVGGAAAVRHQEQVDTLAAINLEALGHYPDSSVDVYSRDRRMVHHIRSLPRLSYPELGLIAGETALTRVHPGHDAITGLRNMDDVRLAIGYMAGQNSLVDQTPVGLGVWPADSQVVLVNARSAATVDPGAGTLTDVNSSRVGRQILDFTASEPWYDPNTLSGLLTDALDPQWRLDCFSELLDLCRRWRWRYPHDAAVAASLACLCWVQTALPWRPEVVLTGSSDTGKSTFCRLLLRNLYGSMAMYTDQSTEAGIRQGVRNRAVVIILDEFEKCRERQKVLNLFRSSSAGAVVRRGTADHKGAQFRIQHIPWMSAIESGLNEEADKNRCIVLNLERMSSSVRGRLTLPSEDQLNNLGMRLLACALVTLPEVVRLYHHLKVQAMPGVNGRVVESFAVPAAFYATMRGADMNAARQILADFLDGKEMFHQNAQDELLLIRTIMESHFDVYPGRRSSVAEALSSESNFTECRRALERHGVALVSDRRGPRTHGIGPSHHLVINTAAVKRYLLKNTRWAELNIDQLLERLPGAVWKVCSIDTHRVTCLHLPSQDYIAPPENTTPTPPPDDLTLFGILP